MPHHKGEDYKETAVKHYLQNKNQIETCHIFGCSPRSLMRWVERYQKSGTTKRENRPAVAYKIQNTHVQYMIKQIRTNPTITIEELHTKLLEAFPTLDISRVHVGRVVRDNNLTLKRTRLRHEPVQRYGKPIDIKEQLQEFYNTIKKYKIDDMISIDETSLGSFMVRKYCRNRIGKRCVLKTHNQEVFKKYTGIFAISTSGCIGYDVYESGGIDGKRLIEFLENHILSEGQTGKVVILDNASSHRNPHVKKFVLQNNNLLYSVPYQHYTNPIENFFSVLKSHLQKEKSIGRDTIIQSIRTSLQKIPKRHYRNFFKNAFERKETPPVKKPSTREKELKHYLKSAF